MVALHQQKLRTPYVQGVQDAQVFVSFVVDHLDFIEVGGGWMAVWWGCGWEVLILCINLKGVVWLTIHG
jgi:hypothetical protein